MRAEQTEMIDIIVSQPNIDYSVKTEDGDTLLHTAIRRGVEEFVQTLALKAGGYYEILTNGRPVSDQIDQ